MTYSRGERDASTLHVHQKNGVAEAGEAGRDLISFIHGSISVRRMGTGAQFGGRVPKLEVWLSRKRKNQHGAVFLRKEVLKELSRLGSRWCWAFFCCPHWQVSHRWLRG